MFLGSGAPGAQTDLRRHAGPDLLTKRQISMLPNSTLMILGWQVDLKDKWRNLERQGIVGPNDLPAQPLPQRENQAQVWIQLPGSLPINGHRISICYS